MSESQAEIGAGATGRWSGYLKKDDGTRIGAGNVTAMTATHINAATGTALNSRSDQNILGAGAGANDFDLTDTSVNIDGTSTDVTILGWHIQAADSELEVTSPDVDGESHPCLMKVTYTDGLETKVLEHTHRLECVDTLGLCTYADVAAIIKGADQDEHKMLIESWIRMVSRRVERKTGRKLRKATTNTTQVLSPQMYATHLDLDRYPIDAIDSIKEDIEGDFAGATSVDTGAYYANSRLGRVEFRRRAVLAGRGSVQVTYTGGLYRETGAVPADLRFAVARQVAFMVQRKDMLGASSVSLGGESVGNIEVDMLPELKEQIGLLKRVRI